MRKLAIWDKDHPQAQVVRKLGYGTHGSHATYATYATYIENADPEIAANAIICLIHQTNYLLDQQLRRSGTSLRQRRRLAGTHDPCPS